MPHFKRRSDAAGQRAAIIWRARSMRAAVILAPI
jgi:hypothetical protein